MDDATLAVLIIMWFGLALELAIIHERLVQIIRILNDIRKHVKKGEKSG